MYRFATIVAGLMLIGALLQMPYGYYQLLRLVVCTVSAFGTWVAVRSNSPGWSIALGLLTLLFNPLFPVYFDRGNWAIIDMLAAGVIMFSGASLEQPDSNLEADHT